MAQVQAGWYPDPGHPERMRYWNGQQWTDQIMPAAAAYLPAADGSIPSKGLFVFQALLLAAALTVSVVGAFLVQGLDSVPPYGGGCRTVTPAAETIFISKAVLAGWLVWFLGSTVWTQKIAARGQARGRKMRIALSWVAGVSGALAGAIPFWLLTLEREPLGLLVVSLPVLVLFGLYAAGAIVVRSSLGDNAGGLVSGRTLGVFTAVLVAQGAGVLVLATWGPVAGLAMSVSAC